MSSESASPKDNSAGEESHIKQQEAEFIYFLKVCTGADHPVPVDPF